MSAQMDLLKKVFPGQEIEITKCECYNKLGIKFDPIDIWIYAGDSGQPTYHASGHGFGEVYHKLMEKKNA